MHESPVSASNVLCDVYVKCTELLYYVSYNHGVWLIYTVVIKTMTVEWIKILQQSYESQHIHLYKQESHTVSINNTEASVLNATMGDWIQYKNY